MQITKLFGWLPAVLAAHLAGPGAATGAAVDKTVLSKANVAVGSAPYRDTVERYLDNKEPKIVGGVPASILAYPWQVSLGVSWIANPFRSHFCGGSIYSATWIVTAAHCVHGNAARDIVVTAGTDELAKGGVRSNVRRIVMKQDFQPSNLDNDIALLELVEPLPLGETMQPIGLLAASDEGALLQPDTLLAVTGWGATVDGGAAVRRLQQVSVAYVDSKQCNAPLAYDGRITPNMLCAGTKGGGTCQRDSGGPLSLVFQGKPRLAGIVSSSEGCAMPGRVGVYARVPRYASWVAQCVGNPGTCQ